MRHAIAAIPDGTYHYEDYLDSDNRTGNPVLLTVAVHVKGDSLELDFEGSSPQVAGPTNGSLAVTAMGSFVALKALLDPEGAINHGAFRPVTVKAPLGSIVNVQPPGAVGGYTEIRRRVESVVMGALSRAVPKYAAGDIKGASNHTYIGSYNPTRQRETIFYEYPAGGTGGFLEHDGNHALRAYDEGDFASIQPAEAVEIEHALLIEDCSLREDSCGDGRHRGGLGMHREVRLLAESGKFSELSDRNIIPPYGVCGGHSAAPNHFYVVRNSETIAPSPIPGKISGFPMNKDDIAVLESAGGGGYGLALERDPEKVLADLREGFITEKKAAERYGVVIGQGKIDDAATKQKRAALVEASTKATVIEGRDVFQDGRRVCAFSPADARKLGGDGALIEMVSATGAPLRAWIKSDPEAKPGMLSLGPKARNILMISANEKVELRVLRQGVRP